MSGEFILWKHDPCPEGGWHIACTYPTMEEAVNAAKVTHAEEERNYLAMAAFCKDPANGPPQEWPRSGFCYDGCMVTGPAVFEIGWEAENPNTEKGEKA